jgi:3-hydroxybutyrate dehydrogenase
MKLADRVALVTGGGSGIGRAIAVLFAEEGAHVVVNDARRESAEQTVAELKGPAGGRAIEADVADSAQVRAMFATIERELGALDVLVNNAGIQFVAPVDEFPDQKWEQIVSINLSANFYAIKAALPGMKRRNWGRIVNIASAHGLVASPFKSAYVAAKHGVLGLTKTVALEAAETAVTCNAICPGYVKTPLVEGQIKDQAKTHNMSEAQVIREVILGSQPNKRFVEVEELGGLVLFLCSPAAASITGAALPMEGGWTAR